jgi:hypothetical protein
METTKISKLKWSKTCERNPGHTCSECNVNEKPL